MNAHDAKTGMTDSGPPRWRRRAAERPGEILEAALSVFVAKGFAAARLDDVAAQAGVSKGTLYLYFDNKAELFKDVIRQTLLAPIVNSVEAAEMEPDPATALKALIAGIGRLLADDRRSAIPKLVISESGTFPELAAFYLNEIIKPMRARIANIVRRGVQSGQFRPVNSSLIFMIVMGPCLLSAIWRHTMQVHDSMKLNVEELMHLHEDVLLNGLLADDASEARGE
jgi:AcrR family transcriptional regulator